MAHEFKKGDAISYTYTHGSHKTKLTKTVTKFGIYIGDLIPRKPKNPLDIKHCWVLFEGTKQPTKVIKSKIVFVP